VLPCCALLLLLVLQLSALVLSKLLSSLPHMRRHLRAGYLLGDTRHDGTAGGLAMNNKVRVLQTNLKLVCCCSSLTLLL
jgi:hypothetical protein